ncbi:hypothetical protein INR49_013633 [Caranx melampygus]|nr:hypothetical protein INR49_013633 [Caranx melampygus]
MGSAPAGPRKNDRRGEERREGDRERGREGKKGEKNTVVHFVSAENPRKEGERTGSAEGDGNERGVSKEETLSL